MSLPRYDRYKESGVEWLGEVPEHWSLQRLRFLFEIKKRIVGELGPDVLSITQQGIRVKDIESNDGQLSQDYSKYQIVEPGDFAMNHMDLLTGYVDIANVAGVTSPDYRVFCVRRDVVCDEKYFLFLFQNAYRRRIFYAFGQGSSHLGRWRLPTEQFNDFVVPLPPLDEQSRIAEFLDQETVKIDALIEEQRRLIVLLKEKRQAVISHAVTKGLNPAVAMKDSGVEWLGEVPVHWSIEPLKRLLAVLTDYTANGSFASLAENVTYLPSGYSRLVRLTDLRENLANDGLYVDESAHKYLRKSELFGGEVLIANVGAYAGYACLMPNGMGVSTLGPNMYLTRFRPDKTTNEYAWLCLTSYGATEQLNLAATSTAQPKLNKDDIRDCIVALPPTLVEQAEILEFVRRKSNEFEQLQKEVEHGVSLLQERRSALISAAVTGKIDVRNYSPRETPSHEEVYEPA